MTSKTLRYKVGDTVRVKSALNDTELVGNEYKILYVGPWEIDDVQYIDELGPVKCLHPADYIIDNGFTGDPNWGVGVQCREDNLE